MHYSKAALFARATAATVVSMLAALAMAGTAMAATPSRVYVSPAGDSGNSGKSCATARYNTIGDGVASAAPGAIVVACRGTYHEMVTIDKPLTLHGRNAVIDASGYDNGILIDQSSVTVDHMTVHGATGEGILAVGSAGPIDHLLIEYNVVRNNDQGGPESSYGECQPQGEVPGDCGEGIHLMTVSNSKVVGNWVEHNAGGILLTDEFGPTHGNLIARNLVSDNQYDCGITLASHNAGWDPGSQSTLPAQAGVYDNVVRDNVVNRNGLKGEGAGVLIAAAFPLAAAYDNTVEQNALEGNELAGITIHSHPGGGYVNGNVLVGNKIGRNNLGGDPDAGVWKTAGIIVYSSDEQTHVIVRSNVIHNDYFGIWFDPPTVSASLRHDVFLDVAVPIKHG